MANKHAKRASLSIFKYFSDGNFEKNRLLCKLNFFEIKQLNILRRASGNRNPRHLKIYGKTRRRF